MANVSAETYRDFVESNNVHLVIVYDECFPGEIPGTWKKLASMHISRTKVSAAYPEVQFYVTDPQAADKLLPELEDFSKSLPPRERMTIYDHKD
jgi:hypothetical protein